MINISFDQYQRYKNVANLINRLRTENEVFRILEVGANEHQNLELFLPNDTIFYLDIQIPDQLLNNPQYILGDATEMSFSNDSFDIVVALDVFEHIPPRKREDFINELYRVSSQFFVLTAPFYSPEVIEAEKRVNKIYNLFFKTDFIWLEEHSTNGLPKQEKLESQLKNNHYPYCVFNHGNIDVWEKLMGVHFIAASNPELLMYRQEIDDYYNRYLFDYDFTDSSYRKIFVVGKERSIEAVQMNPHCDIPQDRISKINELVINFYRLATLMNPKQNVPQRDSINKVDMPDYLQVFIDEGQGFKEENSYIVKHITEQSARHFSKEVNYHHSIASIRIDPSNYMGIFKLYNIRFFDNNGETVSRYTISGNYSFVHNYIYLFEEDDPQIIIKFDSTVDLKRIEFDVLRFFDDYRVLIPEIKNDLLTLKDVCEKRLIQINRLNCVVSEITDKKNEASVLLAQKEEELKSMQLEFEILRSEMKIIESKNENEMRIIQEQLALKSNELNRIYNSRVWKLIKRTIKT
ncbi:methyltransferase domain-containing protein [Paenibacillus lautus]|uniref:class I SAM-dependent methyltransferase n=1 Tax=Paenibacillus lautus TaxID=1401 RepID=UPI002DBAB07F|nr:methyltransferase domain-containing protein [Paenibacillus lautus]MEC0310686.1 methyltransferase domain-containing protein [Paenibacillus lautus]